MNNFITEYERLRKLAHDLDVVIQAGINREDEQFTKDLTMLKAQANRIQAQLIKVEAQLPKGYVFPGYPILKKPDRAD